MILNIKINEHNKEEKITEALTEFKKGNGISFDFDSKMKSEDKFVILERFNKRLYKFYLGKRNENNS